MTTSAQTVLARADGSMLLGMGNVTRCMAIAKEFEARGFRISWAGREHDSRVKDYVTSSGCEYVALPEQLSMEDDASFTRTLARSKGAQFIIVDLANPTATKDERRYSRYLHELARGHTLAIVDDMTRAIFPSAVVVNPNTGVSASDYDCGSSPTFLFGPEHAILRTAYRGVSPRKSYSEGPPKRVVVSLGGGDTARGIMPNVLRGIREGLGSSLDVRLVVGLDDGQAFHSIADQLGFEHFTVLHNLPSLVEELLSADIAVVSGGVTKYEAAATGTPMVIVATIEHQESWGKLFAETGAALYTGGPEDMTVRSMASSCAALMASHVRREVGLRGAALVDGFGATRIVAACFELARKAPRDTSRNSAEGMHSND